MQARLQEGVVAGSIVLSASTYLFDFASNVVVLREYTARYIHALNQSKSACDATCRRQNSYVAGYFYGLVTILLFSHIVSALLFRLRFKKHHAPCLAAYFLPLIHLYDLCKLLWRTLSYKGVQDLRTLEMNALYSILGTALEGVPMLFLQLAAYLMLNRLGVFVHGMPTEFKVSVVASLISAAYNGGASVQSEAENAMKLKENVIVGAIAGGFTLSATVLRCVTFLNILVYITEYHWTEQDEGKFIVSDLLFVLVSACTITAHCLYYWLLYFPTNFFRSLRDLRRLFTSLAFGYMSLFMGPLYPMVSLAKHSNQLGQCTFRWKLSMLALLNLALDLTILFVALAMGTLIPKPYLIVSLVAAAFYSLFLCAYMKFDALCGPIRSSLQHAEPQSGQPNPTELHAEPESVQPGQNENAEAPFIKIIPSCERGVAVPCPIQRRAAAPHEIQTADTKSLQLAGREHTYIELEEAGASRSLDR